jgi:hypothetical protein
MTGAAAALALLLAAEGTAQTQAPGELRLYLENDSLLNPFPTRTDRYYTHGTRLEWILPEAKSDLHFLPGVDHSDWCSLVCGKHFAEGRVNTGFALGQNMYTPDDISVAAPQPNDRPWAGLLYVSRIARVSYVQWSLNAQRQDRIEVSLGVVGPASFAKEVQVGWHDLWGFAPLNGWHNQLRNEPVLQLRYDTALRWPREDGGHADIIPRVRANVGNALTSLEAEVTGRIGWNLSGFGVQTIAPQLEPAAIPDAAETTGRAHSKWRSSANLFLRAGIKAVAHNITLDGNTFARNNIRIERKPFVPEIGGGFELNLIRNFSVTFQFVHRGSEFESRNGRDAPAHEFGSLTLAWALGD